MTILIYLSWYWFVIDLILNDIYLVIFYILYTSYLYTSTFYNVLFVKHNWIL